MLIATGIVCVVFGLVSFVGQAISVLNFPLAQRLGLQESNEATDALFRRAERNAARWDLFVLWTLPFAGILMLLDDAAWPAAATIAGAMHLDAAGREIAKTMALQAEGVRIGTEHQARIYRWFLVAMGLVGLWCVGYGLCELLWM